jgi:hypothetical protein
VEGSPIKRTFISPLRWVPFSKFFSAPPSNCKIKALFIYLCPYIEGAKELDNTSNTSVLEDISFMFLMSLPVTLGISKSEVIDNTLEATKTVLKYPERVVAWEAIHLNTPTTCTLLNKY